MTLEYAIYFIPRRMRELGFARRDYYDYFRHLLLQPNETREIAAYNQIFFLVEDSPDVTIRSELGIYDLSAINANEMQYEHQGAITLQNQTNTIKHLRFIQVIPQFEQKNHASND